MAVSTKIIKKRIRSIGNTKKITRAMEMVAATKMRKAVNAVLASRPYAFDIWAMVMNLISRLEIKKHPLLTPKSEAKKVAIILVTSNRGLCGGFNSQIVSRALKLADQAETAVEWLAIGRWGAEFLARSGKKMVAVFEKPDVILTTSEISALVKAVTGSFVDGTYQKVFVAYTDFYSALVQKPRLKQLLPLEPLADAELGQVGQASAPQPAAEKNFEYLFEPTPQIVFNELLPHLVTVQLYQAMLESTASEHSARMMAMKNATNAAADMIDDLTLAFNQARQAAITREIAEITGGKAALEAA